MGLAKRPPPQDIISFQQWSANRAQGILQPHMPHIGSSSSQLSRQTEEEDDDEIVELHGDFPSKEVLVTISRNQRKLNQRLVNVERTVTKTNKKLNTIKCFLNKIWEKISCTGSASTSVAENPPAPFSWTTSIEEEEEESESDEVYFSCFLVCTFFFVFGFFVFISLYP